MLLKKIVFEQDPIFGNTVFDFCDSEGKPYKTIILAGENGTGKSSLLNVIYNFFADMLPTTAVNKHVSFVFELSELEVSILNNNNDFKARVAGYEIGNELTLKVNHSISGTWGAVTATIARKDVGEPLSFDSYLLTQSDTRQLFKAIYSDVDVNYSSDVVTSTTSLDVDRDEYIAKSSVNLAKEVTQLLVDIDGLDNSDLNEWVLNNPDSKVSERPTNTRMSRFKNAFESIFPNKKFKKVSNSPGAKEVLFEEFGKQMSINNLSSGEKQIVFRGSFLLRNKRSTERAVILIDEPEISLHPNWQLKILDFYKNLFKDENGIQTSQIFVATHSPFIIHNETRSDDKVIILKKDENGNTFLPTQGEFYSWSGEEAIKEAFNIALLQEKIKKSPKHLIITEGKTDWKHLKRALSKLNYPITTHIEFLEYEDNIEMGSTQLIAICQSLSKLQNNFKIIAIFDRDETNIIKQTSGVEGSNFKNWGNNVYSFALPVPEHRVATPNICIEHYYTDEEIKLYDVNSRRLYMGNEFSQKFGVHKNEEKACVYKNKCGNHSIQIIDDGVSKIRQEEINIALPKSNFADYILNDIEPFNQVNSNNFSIVFDIIRQIVDEGSE